MGLTLDDIYFLGLIVGCVLAFGSGYQAGSQR